MSSTSSPLLLSDRALASSLDEDSIGPTLAVQSRPSRADSAARRDALAPDPGRQMSEHDLAGNAEEAHEPECPAGVRRTESELDEVLRLMDLHGVPREEPEEVCNGDPPEAARTDGAGERPVDGRP